MSDQKRDYQGGHAAWCTNRDGEYTLHSDSEPYCSNQVGKVSVLRPNGADAALLWVDATTAFTYGHFTSAEAAERERIYGGVELCLEIGPTGQDDSQRIRITADVARTLAALLIRAADIQHGLDR